MLASLFVACTQSDAPTESGAQASGAGGAGQGGAGAGGFGGSIFGTGGGSSSERPCTPNLPPDDEFFVPCEDSGTPHAPSDASSPDVDAAVLPDAGEEPEPDAGEQPEPDAGDPPVIEDDSPCSDRTPDCDVGRTVTTLGSATCQIDGHAVSVQREICEVCDKATLLVDFSLVVMPCGVCSQVYRETPFTVDQTIAAGECRMRSDSADLTWSASDPYCIDLYAYVGSGRTNGPGTYLEVSDQVRICRCDRTTDTCITCAGGACDVEP